MAQQKLPTPATANEMFLYAAVEELRRLNKNIEGLLKGAQQDATGNEVTLKEPAKSSTRDAKQAANTLAKDSVGPVTVETVETVKPSKG